MRQTDDRYNVAEFYHSGKTHPFKRLLGCKNLPAAGDLICFDSRPLEVSSVTWNLDYAGERGEQWRANVYLVPADAVSPTQFAELEKRVNQTLHRLSGGNGPNSRMAALSRSAEPLIRDLYQALKEATG